jgi:hypothetical protein
MTVVLDDHLLRDWMVGPDPVLLQGVDGEDVATTNLWYARLCKSVARAVDGALVGELSGTERRALASRLIMLPQDITVVPLRELAWPMGLLMAEHGGLSTLGAEAVATTVELDARLLVSSRDVSPGIQATCTELGVPHGTIRR